jgi:hypothetical protein
MKNEAMTRGDGNGVAWARVRFWLMMPAVVISLVMAISAAAWRWRDVDIVTDKAHANTATISVHTDAIAGNRSEIRDLNTRYRYIEASQREIFAEIKSLRREVIQGMREIAQQKGVSYGRPE